MTRDEYVRNVGWWLRDLPWSTRRDLLAELLGHLDELPADTDFRAQLGPPETYAGDLRAAAGLERRRGLIAFLRARRPRNLILLVLALTVAGLAIGAVVWIDRYQPIVYGNATQDPLDSKPSKARLLVNKPNPAENERPLERFRPFDLHPGETRWLVWKGVYACTTGMGGGGGAVTREAIPVRFSFLWRTETAFVPAQDPLTITFPKGCPPPARYR